MTTYTPRHYIGGPVDEILYDIMLTQEEQDQFKECMRASGIDLANVWQVYPRVRDTCVFHVDYFDGTTKFFVLRGELPEWWEVPLPDTDFFT